MADNAMVVDGLAQVVLDALQLLGKLHLAIIGTQHGHKQAAVMCIEQR